MQKAQSIRKFTTAGDMSSASAKGSQFSFFRERRFPAEHRIVAEDQIAERVFALRYDVGPTCIWISIDLARHAKGN